MHKFFLSLIAVCYVIPVVLGASVPLYHYDFAKKTDIVLKNNAVQQNGYLHFDGKGSYAIIPNSEKFNLTKKGLTITCVARFSEHSRLGQDLVSKGRSFLMSRNDTGFLFFGLYSDKWNLVQGGNKVEFDKWAHYAMSIEYVHDAGRGWDYYRLNSFINGEKVASSTFSHIVPLKENDKPLVLGGGLGAKHWAMNGDIAEVKVYDHFLPDGEIEDLALTSPRVELQRKDRISLHGNLQDVLKTLKKQHVCAEAKWLISALERSVAIGANQTDLLSLIKSKQQVFSLNSGKKIQQEWNEGQQICRFMLTDDLAALLMINGKGSCFPLTSLFDRHAGKELLSSYGIYWQVDYRKGRRRLESVKNYDNNVTWSASVDGNHAQIEWTHPIFKAKAHIKLNGRRLESDLHVESTAKEHLISQVIYPGVIFAIKNKPNDNFLHMSGELIKNPSVNGLRSVPSTAFYPTGHVPLQFCAYYDDCGGVYFAAEDPKAVSKRFTLKGQQRGIEVNWLSWAPYKVGQKENNHYIFSGKGVIETFKGSWYDAAHIYRRFLDTQKVFWWPDIPRKMIAKWYANNPFWFVMHVRNGKYAMDLNRMLFYRKYFELPFGVHAYGIWDQSYGDTMTHYRPAPFTKGMVKILKQKGIAFKPYTDSQLWATKDGPYKKSDWKFSSHGKKYAVKNFNGSMNYETYANLPYAVMCPACPAWQEEQIRRIKEMVSWGCNAIYHDEMLAARPFTCYDETHGHLLNDPAMWLHDGYLKIMRQLRAQLPADIGHDTEGFEEPLVGLQDGFLCWGPPEDVPLYRAVFGSRIDLIGRHFSYVWQFNEKTERRFYIILAQQFINGEQMGWCEPGEMINYPHMMLHTKKMIHLRSGLLNFFNEAELLRPLKFPVKPQTTSYIWDGEGGKRVPTPKILCAAYGRKDGLKLLLMQNVMLFEKESCTPQIDYLGKIAAIFDQNSGEAKIIKYNNSLCKKLDFDPLEIKMILISDNDDTLFRNETARISNLLKKVAAFKAPVVPDNLKISNKDAVPRKKI